MSKQPAISSARPGSMTPQVSEGVPFWICLLAVVVLFAGSLGRELWTPDEPREAAITMAMFRTGNFVVPELAGQPFVEKPPLYYITGAGFMRGLGGLFGPTQALRIAGLCWGLATLIVVYRLMTRLMNSARASAITCMLAVMPGFAHVSHCLIVDQALLFWVAACLWLVAEAYYADKPWALVFAGACAAGAFLTKGIIGLAVIGFAGIGLVVSRLAGRSQGNSQHQPSRWVLAHVAAVFLFVVLAGIWVVLFWRHVDADLFHEWFWRNNIGRFLGQTPDLGHHNGLFYYFGVIPLYVLPWLPMFLLGIWNVFADCKAGGWRKDSCLFMLCWGVGGVLLLSLSETKREIYLAVLLPAFALFSESGWRCVGEFTWLQRWNQWWATTCLVALGILAFGSLAMPVFADAAIFPGLPKHWLLLVCICVACFALAILVFRSSTLSMLSRQTALTALLAIVAFEAVTVLGDSFKNYAPTFRGFLNELAIHSELKPASWRFDETSRAGLYYFGNGVSWPGLSDIEEVKAVLQGQHPQYNAVIAFRKIGNTEPVEVLADAEAEVLALRVMGRNRELRLITALTTKEHPMEP